MPSNKIGGLKTGQGLRRIQGQRKGGWRDEDAKANYEIGAEFKPQPEEPNPPTRSGRWGGGKG